MKKSELRQLIREEIGKLKEIDFDSQEDLVAYKKAHKMRPGTQVNVAGKKEYESDEILNAKEKFRRAKKAYNVALGNHDEEAAKKAHAAMAEFHAIFSAK